MCDKNICINCWEDIPHRPGWELCKKSDRAWGCRAGWRVCLESIPPRNCLKLFEQSVAMGVVSVNIDTEVAPDGGKGR